MNKSANLPQVQPRQENQTCGRFWLLDIKDDKIWIQHEGTETGVANELTEMGVPKQDIVLAFYAPYKRPYKDFAVG